MDLLLAYIFILNLVAVWVTVTATAIGVRLHGDLLDLVAKFDESTNNACIFFVVNGDLSIITCL